MMISEKALALIIECEVTSRSHYERALQRPTWPGAESGATIGIGYDLGYVQRSEFVSNWSPHLSEDEIETLLPAVGVKGQAAEDLVRRLQEVSIPWNAALSVFASVTVPKFEAAAIIAFPGCETLHTDCFGALVSLVFNRGPSMGKPGDDRRAEMRLIRKAIAAGDPADVPGLLRDMKRLWPDLRGLRDRRDAEAALFEQGLLASGVAVEGTSSPPPPPSPQGSAPPSPMRKGSVGTAVRILQEALTAAGFRATVDGNFGPDTEAAVRDFQFSVGLEADGVVGPKTLSALNLV